jgi:hypothetical protein
MGGHLGDACLFRIASCGNCNGNCPLTPPIQPLALMAFRRWMTDLQLACDSGALPQHGMHPRHIKDVRLALSRAMARSNIYAAGAA